MRSDSCRHHRWWFHFERARIEQRPILWRFGCRDCRCLSCSTTTEEWSYANGLSRGIRCVPFIFSCPIDGRRKTYPSSAFHGTGAFTIIGYGVVEGSFDVSTQVLRLRRMNYRAPRNLRAWYGRGSKLFMRKFRGLMADPFVPRGISNIG